MDIDTPPVEVRRAAMHFGAIYAVDGIDLSVQRGEILGLIGRNGAGKSTLFKMMLGLLVPTSGSVHIEGIAVTSPAFRAIRRRIGYLPENVVLYDHLDGLETLHFFARLKGVPNQQCLEVLQRVGLLKAGRRRVRDYSRGMRQRLGLAQALLGTPSLLFLDEPTSGLDPEATRDFYTILGDLRASGTTIILTSHVLAELQDRVDRLAIIAMGKLQALGTLEALRAKTPLPLTIQLRVASLQLPTVIRALSSVHGLTITTIADGLCLHCLPARRMAALTAVIALGDEIQDLQIRDPSLEDVFLGLASQTP